MGEFAVIAEKLEKIDVFKILRDITKENDVQKWVKDTVQGRWQTKGQDAFGNFPQTDRSGPGEVYADLTIILKEQNSGVSGIVSHITLTESGAFWDSFRIIVKSDGWDTTADFIKEDGHMQRNFTQDYGSKKEFEDAVTDLKNEELAEMIKLYYYPRFEKKINDILS
jgi:hypothetical protein